MSRLRPHQLRHPDLVTEGMNRIAQALLAVTAFGSTTSPSSPPVVRPAPMPHAAPTHPAAPPVSLEPSRPATPAGLQTRAEPKILDAEVVEAVPEPIAPLPEPPRPAPLAKKRVPAVEAQPVLLPVEDVGSTKAARRAAYAELAALRALRRAWDKLGPFVGDPSESLPTPGHICEFLEAVIDLRSALRHSAHPDGLLADAAPLVDVVMRQPLVLATFRPMTHSQRLQLARDWAVGRATFTDQYDQLRKRLTASRPAKRLGDRCRDIGLALAHNPEWVLVVGTVALTGLAVLRSVA